MLPVYVMIGGRSRRFGQDKATYLVEREPWAWHVGRRLAAKGEGFTLVGGSGVDGDESARWVPDAEGLSGPLAGVVAAIEDRRRAFGEGLFVLASCDLVRPKREWLVPLVEAHGRETQLEVAAYRTARLWQPFPSVIHTRWSASLQATAVASDRSLQSAFERAEIWGIDWSDPSGPPQANTPEKLREVLASSKGED